MQFIFFLSEKVNGEYVGWSTTSRVYKTTNSGNTWTEIYTGLSGGCGAVTDIHFVDSSKGVIIRQNKCINKTTDGGYNWSTIPTSQLCLRIAMGDENIGWVTLSTDSVLKTTDFFITHGKQPLPALMGLISALDTSLVYGVGGFMGNVLKTTNGGGLIVSSIEPISNTATGYELKQNYPNPFNPTTTIEFWIQKSSIVNIKIYDVLGREVINAIDNKHLNTGSYQINLTFDKLPSGLYIYEMTASDKSEILYRSVKKMIYTK